MSFDLGELATLSDQDILDRAIANPEWYYQIARQVDHAAEELRRHVALTYYAVSNPEALKVHTSTAREIAVLGGNRSSLPLTAPVLMADGSWKPLGDIALNDRIIAADPLTREGRSARVLRVFRAGPEEVFRIHLGDGGSFEATATHHIPLVTRPQRGEQPVKRLLGDVLDRIRNTTPNTRVSVFSPSVIEFSPTATPSLDPYTLGALIGDGGMTDQTPRFFNVDAAVLARVADGLAPLGIRMKQYDAVTWGLIAREGFAIPARDERNALKVVLKALGLFGCGAGAKHVPEEVFRYTHKDRLQFLSGLLDTDGTLGSYCTVSDRLARDFVRLVHEVGGRATIGRNRGPRGNASIVYWNIPHRLPMALTRKQVRGERYLDTTKRPCVRVESLGIAECGDLEVDDPAHCYVTKDYIIVSNSKTTTALAELAIQMTGHIPESLFGVYPREKIRAPIRARIVCNSLTDTLEPVIKPKLRWDAWNGVGDPKDGRGHWGWVPRHCLKGSTWEMAWSEKYRTLSAAVDNFWTDAKGNRWSMTGMSTCQMLSYDQDLSAFAGSSMHLVVHDELPPADIYRENRMRIMDVSGQIITAFTPPDEVGISRADVAWFYDEVYERGLPGPSKDPRVDTVTLWTERNRILSPADIAEIARTLTEEQREVRLKGRFIHLSGLVFSLFTPQEAWWCFPCAKRVMPVDGHCLTCQREDLEPFTHLIEPFPLPANWPVVMVIDPHPRKQDAVAWFAVTPTDDAYCVAELQVGGTAGDVAREVRALELARGFAPVRRLMDPNIATETNDKLQRGWTIRKAYDDAGLRCDLANDEINAGIQTVNEWLKPDPATRRPRLVVFRDCTRVAYGMTHFTWDEWTRQGDREPKEKVRDRYKDFPDLLRYFVMDRPSYHGLTRGHARLTWATGRSARGY